MPTPEIPVMSDVEVAKNITTADALTSATSDSNTLDFLNSTKNEQNEETVANDSIQSHESKQIASAQQFVVSPSKDFFEFLDGIGNEPSKHSTSAKSEIPVVTTTGDNDNFLSFLDSISTGESIKKQSEGSVAEVGNTKSNDDDFLSSLDSIGNTPRPMEQSVTNPSGEAGTQKKASALSKNIKVITFAYIYLVLLSYFFSLSLPILLY